MAPPAEYPVELRRQVFLGSTAIAAGLLTRRQLDGKRWRRINHDVFADAALALDHLLLVRGVALLMPTGAVIDGRSAAHAWGVPMAAPDQPVEVWTPVPFGPVTGVRIRRSAVQPGCVTRWRGGQWHADRDQLTRDRRRLRDLTAAGWQIYHITRDDLNDLDRLAHQIAAALERRATELAK